MRTKRCRKHMSNGSVFFMFAGLVATVTLATVVFTQSDVARVAVGEFPSLAPDLPALLPSGATYLEDSVIEVFRGPSENPVFVVGHARPRQSDVSVVAWETAKGQYIRTADVPLVFPQGRVQGVPEVMVEPLGRGLPTVVLAKGRSGVSRESAFLMVLSGSTLGLASLQDSAYQLRDAVFQAGSLINTSEEPMVFDVDGDGAAELVVTIRERGTSGEPVIGKRVYAWRSGGFVLDPAMTWALDTSSRLFPEPPEPTTP